MRGVQVLSGMGGIRLCYEFVKDWFAKGTTIYVSDPTWGPHKGMAKLMGIPFTTYRYYDSKNICVDFKGMCEDLNAAPSGSVFLI